MTERMRDLPNGFRETEIGPIPVEWEVEMD